MLKQTVFLTLTLLFVGMGASAYGQERNQAGLVVTLADGTAVYRCVEFIEDEITGFELLNRSGLAVETGAASIGASVCRVEETGCPGSDCFCQCKGSECIYWSYWHWVDDGWQYSQVGASIYPVKNGAVEGWTWGPGTPQNALEPPPVTFEEICAIPATAPDSGSAVRTSEPVATAKFRWLGYAFLGLIVVGLGGLLLARGWRRL